MFVALFTVSACFYPSWLEGRFAVDVAEFPLCHSHSFSAIVANTSRSDSEVRVKADKKASGNV